MATKGKTRVHYPDYQSMLAKLIQARVEAGLTQVEAAARLGKLQNFVSKVERGERRIDPPELLQFAQLYGKDWSYFLVDSENTIGDQREEMEEMDKTGKREEID